MKNKIKESEVPNAPEPIVLNALEPIVLTLPNETKMEFMPIPAGKFVMGSPKNEAGRNKDENQVQVNITKAFYMGKTEVTQAQWKSVMDNNPSYFKGDNLPVECVSWKDAMAFCRKLT